jgi:hypothetical protein
MGCDAGISRQKPVKKANRINDWPFEDQLSAVIARGTY